MAALKYAGLHAVALLTALGFLLGGPWMWTGIVIIFALAAVADEVLGEDHGPARDQKSWLYEVLLWVTPFVQSIVVVCLALQVDRNLGIISPAVCWALVLFLAVWGWSLGTNSSTVSTVNGKDLRVHCCMRLRLTAILRGAIRLVIIAMWARIKTPARQGGERPCTPSSGVLRQAVG